MVTRTGPGVDLPGPLETAGSLRQLPVERTEKLSPADIDEKRFERLHHRTVAGGESRQEPLAENLRILRRGKPEHPVQVAQAISRQAGWKVAQEVEPLVRCPAVGLQSLSPKACLLYTSPSPRDKRQSRMPSSA